MLVNCWSPALTSDHTPVMVRDHEGSWVRSEDWCARVRECQELRDQLATARSDALEEAARQADDFANAIPFDGGDPATVTLHAIAAAIRALKSETKP